MLIKAVKLLAGLAILLPLAIKAGDLNPPELPVFYYGNALMNHEPAPENTVIAVKKLNDNSELATSSPSEPGKYFFELACQGIIGQSIFFTLNGQVAGESVCPDVATVPSVNLNLELSDLSPNANQWTAEFVFSSDLSSTTAASVKFTPETNGDNKEVTIGAGGLRIKRNALESDNQFEINFSAGTVITGSAAWDGRILAPTVVANSTVSVPDETGMESEVLETIEVGFSGESIIFDQPASILFPGRAGKRIGFSVNGAGFSEIAAVCPENNGDSLRAGVNECKFNGLSDLTVWTNHFTLFAFFVQNPSSPAPASSIGHYGGGSSSLTVSCQKIGYGPWGECLNGTQTRSVALKTPDNCQLDDLGKSFLTQKCEAVKIEEGAEEIKEAESGGEVLGEKIYPDGTLIKSIDRKIYYLENGFRRHIVNQNGLKKFNKLPVHEVSIFTVYAYPEGEKILGYTEGDLVRGKDLRIYHIKDGAKVWIRTLEELRKNYFGRPIIDAQ